MRTKLLFLGFSSLFLASNCQKEPLQLQNEANSIDNLITERNAASADELGSFYDPLEPTNNAIKDATQLYLGQERTSFLTENDNDWWKITTPNDNGQKCNLKVTIKVSGQTAQKVFLKLPTGFNLTKTIDPLTNNPYSITLIQMPASTVIYVNTFQVEGDHEALKNYSLKFEKIQ